MGTQPAETGDHFSQRELAVLDGKSGLGGHVIQVDGVGAGVFLVAVGHRSRSNQQVSVDGRGDQDAFACLGRQLEDGMADEVADFLVQQHVVAAACDDLDGFFTDHVVEFVRIDASGVDHVGRAQALAALQVDFPATINPSDMLHLAVEAELHAILIGVLCQGDGKAEGADDSASRAEQCGDNVLGKVRLQGTDLVTGEDLHVGNAVGDTPVVQFLELGLVSLVEADDQRPILLEVDVKILGKLGHHPRPFNVQFCLQRARNRVVACMDDGAVCLARAAAHVLVLLQQGDSQVVTGQATGNRTPRHASADDQYIIIHLSESSFLLETYKKNKTHLSLPDTRALFSFLSGECTFRPILSWLLGVRNSDVS